jgi:hypothetical protein
MLCFPTLVQTIEDRYGHPGMVIRQKEERGQFSGHEGDGAATSPVSPNLILLLSVMALIAQGRITGMGSGSMPVSRIRSSRVDLLSISAKQIGIEAPAFVII